VRSRLTSHPGWDGYAVWSPDGEKIAFVDAPGGEERIYELDLDSRPFLKIEQANK
jgi:Tol biopolymer transport system component